MPRNRVSVPMVTATIASQTGHPWLNRTPYDGAGQAEHRGHRQVDLAGNDDQRERQRHDGDLTHVETDVEKVRRAQEGRRRGRAEDQGGDQDSGERGLPPEQATQCGTPPAAVDAVPAAARSPGRDVRGHGALLRLTADSARLAGSATGRTRWRPAAGRRRSPRSRTRRSWSRRAPG